MLGENLFGVYLYGSLTQRAFSARRSDLDAIVVTRQVLDPREFLAVGAWLRRSASVSPWVRKLQLSFLVKSSVLTMNAPACLYQFGRLVRCLSDGNPIIWMNVLKSGVILFGPPARSFIPPITDAMLVDALKRELGYLREEITTKPLSKWRHKPSYRIYAVLTVCRVLYSYRTKAIASKPRAARWALEHLPRMYSSLVRRALKAHTTTGNRSTRLILADIRPFIEFAVGQLQCRSHARTH